MKENSIEDDIKIIENLKEAINSGLCYFGSVTMYDCGYQEALEHILSDYKRVLKENEELNLKYYMLYTGKIENLKAQEVKIKSQVIPVQKVKDKIEEIKQEKKKYGNCLIEMYEDELVNRDIKILQELLEGRK